MPRPVRLPEGSPAAQRRLAGLLARPRWGRGLTAGLAAAGMVAVAAGIAALVVVGPLNPGVSRQSAGYSASLSKGVLNGSVPVASGVDHGPTNGSSGCSAGGCAAAQAAPEASPAACSARALSTSAASAAEIPTGFNNHVTDDDSSTRS